MILIEKNCSNFRKIYKILFQNTKIKKNAKIKILKNIKNKGSLKNKTKIKGNLIAK